LLSRRGQPPYELGPQRGVRVSFVWRGDDNLYFCGIPVVQLRVYMEELGLLAADAVQEKLCLGLDEPQYSFCRELASDISSGGEPPFVAGRRVWGLEKGRFISSLVRLVDTARSARRSGRDSALFLAAEQQSPLLQRLVAGGRVFYRGGWRSRFRSCC
jgi:hypothetical protein